MACVLKRDRYLRFKKETTYGEDVNFVEDFSVDLTKTGITIPTGRYTKIRTVRGNAMKYKVSTPVIVSGDFEMPVDIVSYEKFIDFISDEMTETAGVRSYTFNNCSTPQSFLMGIGKDKYEQIVTGTTLGNLTTTLNKEYISMSGTIMGQYRGEESIGSVKDVNSTLLTQIPLASDTFNILINNVEDTFEVRSAFSFSINRNLNADNGISLGEYTTKRISKGDLEITINLEGFSTDTYYLLDSIMGTEFSIECSFEDNNGKYVTFEFPRVFIQDFTDDVNEIEDVVDKLVFSVLEPLDSSEICTIKFN